MRRLKRKGTCDDGGQLVLIYPFAADNVAIENTTKGLLQINVLEQKSCFKDILNERCKESDMGKSSSNLFRECNNLEKENIGEGCNFSKCKEKIDEEKIENNRMNERSHYLTIREEDVERLEQGEFLNDTLVDFWMQWLWRKELEKSNVHFFSSHFFSTLKSGGIDSVKSWTIKKGLNVFSKTFLFIPINQSLHWSLCVVVNPGALLLQNQNKNRGRELIDSDESDDDEDQAYPCLIFLDSLRAHNATSVSKTIRGWLSFEIERNLRAKGERSQEYFKCDAKSLPIFKPKVPYQDNGWDCGVFLCRYAYALYHLYRNDWTIRYRDIHYRAGFRPYLRDHVITENEAFNFGMEDITRLRDEMKVLMRNLSKLFHACKNISRNMNKNELGSSKKGEVEQTTTDGFNDECDQSELPANGNCSAPNSPSESEQAIEDKDSMDY